MLIIYYSLIVCKIWIKYINNNYIKFIFISHEFSTYYHIYLTNISLYNHTMSVLIIAVKLCQLLFQKSVVYSTSNHFYQSTLFCISAAVVLCLWETYVSASLWNCSFIWHCVSPANCYGSIIKLSYNHQSNITELLLNNHLVGTALALNYILNMTA